MKYLLYLGLLVAHMYALSPFTLEGIKAVNVKVLDKGKLLPKELKHKIADEIERRLNAVGIKTQSDEFSNFLVKIQTEKIRETHVVHISMFLVEDVVPLRDRTIENMGITYQKSDFFDTTSADLKTDIYESVVDYLLAEFIEQFVEENS